MKKRKYKQIEGMTFRRDFRKYSQKFNGLNEDFTNLKKINTFNPNNKYSKKLKGLSNKKYVRYKTPFMRGKGIRIIAKIGDGVYYSLIGMRKNIYQRIKNLLK